MPNTETSAAPRNSEKLVVDLGICAEIENITATSEGLAGNNAKAEWHKGKGAGLRQAQAMLRDMLANPLLTVVEEFHSRLLGQTVIAIIIGLIIGWLLPEVGVGFISASIILYVNRVWGDKNCPYSETANNTDEGRSATVRTPSAGLEAEQ